MALTLWRTKGRQLTPEEADANFDHVVESENHNYTPGTGALAGVAHTVKAFLDKLGNAGASLGAALIGFTQAGTATTVDAELTLHNKKATTWYVDSSAGDDDDRGVSDDTALATIAELLTKDINEGDRILLKRGSTWREKLTPPVNNLAIEAYGTGADPILDGADTISTSAWSLSSGNVYQATLTVETTNASALNWNSVWEDSTRLVQVADEATCESTAGSYYPSLTGTTLTLKLHATGSGNPATNGKTYEYAKRSSCIDAYSRVGVVVKGIKTKRQAQSYGSLTLGQKCTAYDCTAADGNTHNVFARSGCKLYRVTGSDGYAFNNSITLFVHYEDTGDSGDVLYEDCVASQTTANAGGDVGFYGHTGASSFGTITYRRCAFDGVDTGIDGLNATSIVIDDPGGEDYDFGIKTGVNTTIRGGAKSLSSSRASAYVITFGAANLTYDIDGLTASVGNTGGGGIQCTVAGCTLNLFRNRISWKSNLITWSGATGTFNSRKNTFLPLSGAARAYWLTGSPTTSSDDNDFGGITDASQSPFIVGASSYATLADYSTATSQDTNSSNGSVTPEPLDTRVVTLFDDFVGDTLDARWNGRAGTDPQCVAPAIRADRINGEITMTTGDDAAADMATNGVQLETSLNWKPNMGGFYVEFRVSVSVITNVAVFVGLTDQNSALEMPFTLGASDTLTSNATDGCGFLFDTAADTDQWCLVGVANDADATKQFTGAAPTANTMETFRIEVDVSSAVAKFFRNGVRVGTNMTAATRIGIAHTPVIAGFSRTTSSRSFFCDFIKMRANRL